MEEKTEGKTLPEPKFKKLEVVSIIDAPKSSDNYHEVIKHGNYNETYGYETTIRNIYSGEQVTMFENLLEQSKLNKENGGSVETKEFLEDNDSIDVDSDFENRVSVLDKSLKTGNNYRINEAVYNLMALLEYHPFLYPKYISKIHSIPKKYRQGTNPYSLDFGLPSVVEWMVKNNINIFELLPVKEYSLPKHKPFNTNSDDKVFMSIHGEFASKDELRPKFLGSNFNINGVTTTDAHRLLFTKYVGKKQDKIGNYCYTQKCFSFEEEVKNDKYPDWQKIIPSDNPYKIVVNVKYLYTFLKNSIELQLVNPITHQIAFKYPTDDYGYIGFNADFLLDAIIAMVKLGHKDLEFSFSSPNRAMLIYPVGKSSYIKSLKTDFVLLMPVMLTSSDFSRVDFDKQLTYDFETNCSKILDEEKTFCFDSDINKEKEFKEKLRELDELRKEVAKLKTPIKVEEVKPTPQIEVKLTPIIETIELSDAIDTFEMLIKNGGSESEILEWTENINVFKSAIENDVNKIYQGDNIENLKGQEKEIFDRAISNIEKENGEGYVPSVNELKTEIDNVLADKYEEGGSIPSKVIHEQLEKNIMESQFG